MYIVKVNDSIVAYGLSSELEAYSVAQQWAECFPDLFEVISIVKVVPFDE